MQHLRRVECGFGWARLLAISQSSLVLLSPVSGEMLVFSWPFLFLKQALDFAYNPSQEELFVSNGTSEVLVLDMTRCPSPVKQILCTRRNKEEDESVMCLEAVMLCGEGWADTKPRPYLVFSGHCSGKLQLLSPSRFHCQVPNAHSDAVLQISSIPGENPQLCCYGADRKLSVWVVKAGEKQIKLTCTTHIYCSTSMILTQLTPGLIFAVSQGHNLLLYSLLDGNCLQLERISSTPISCMDYCASLGLVVISGPAGIVEVWDTHGILLVVIKLGAPVSQVCFANTRGDLLACFNDSIFIIFAVKYLPICMLKQMPAHNQADDLLEDPLPFLQQSFGYYDLDLVSRMLLKPVETKSSEIKTTEPEVEALEPETNMQLSHMEILIEASNQPNILTNKEDQGSQPYRPQVKSKLDEKIQIAEESKEPDTTNDVWNKVETSLEPIILRQEPSGWPVAPDGYIPNSVIRNWGQNQEPEKSKLEVGKPKILQETYGLLEDAHISETVKIVPKDQAQRILKPALLLKQPAQIESVTELHIEKDVNSHKTLLQIIAESPWLVKKPKAVELNPVVSSLTLTMDSMDPDVYDNCTTALCSLYQTYEIPPETKEMLSLTLLQNMQKGNPHWKRLRALKILFQLKLLKEKDMAVIAEVLIDKEHDLHQMARDVLAQVYSIKYKDKLLDHLCSKEVSTRKKLFKQLDDHLTEDLQLQQNIPAVCPKTTREVTVPVSNGHPTPQYDDMSAQMQSYSNIKGITPSDIPALKRHVPAQPSQAPVKVNKSDMSPSEHLKPTQHIRKKYRKFNISFPKRKAILSKSGASYLSLSDSTLVDLYKKIKTKRLTYCPLLLPKPEGLVHMPPTISHQPELNYWEPIKGQGQHNWRENLYHLISQYGFRSPNASRIVRQDPPPTPVQGNLSCTLPTIPTSHLTAGQRLVERIWFKKTLFPSQFHHIQPLPEQLNVHTLDHSGESQYGRLKVDWRAGLMDCTGIKLAPTGPRRTWHWTSRDPGRDKRLNK
ncbi:WD repeat-containing protein 87-like [Trichomycterus rosablanca]|uniref:WD repeat-containing protein 87-like n=1 Tax=Trichomycterus rosablanca TaxID=2290929 RepID=UPI002F35530B